MGQIPERFQRDPDRENDLGHHKAGVSPCEYDWAVPLIRTEHLDIEELQSCHRAEKHKGPHLSCAGFSAPRKEALN